MSDSDPSTTPEHRRRFVPVVWGASTLTAVVLVLGVTGTLSSWSTAIIHNSQDNVHSTAAVSLSESSGGTQCVDTATTGDNTATCSTVNKYTGATLNPDSSMGRTASITVTLANTGTETGHLTLKTNGACVSSADAPSAKPGAYPLCSQVTVALSCPSVTYTAAAVTLTAFAAETAARAIGDLAPGVSTDCTFTLTLPASTPTAYASQQAAQALDWTLSA